ncbi:hypothetical protein SynBIOSU31_02984 [Synechococcus sp. BIOS-U3-1]|nr:hypothetical protein SynBIOSU31_02984 [Synechococcus sp. BIOS-U3-1]
MSPEQRSALQRHHNSTAVLANIAERLLCEGRPCDDEPSDTSITAGQNDTIEKAAAKRRN